MLMNSGRFHSEICRLSKANGYLLFGSSANHQRLLEPIGYIPPAEAEERYYLQLAQQGHYACT